MGSVYKKTRPQAEIRINERDKFWEQTEVCFTNFVFLVFHGVSCFERMYFVLRRCNYLTTIWTF